jgi:hypothetical protein
MFTLSDDKWRLFLQSIYNIQQIWPSDRVGIFCGKVEVVLLNNNFGIGFLKLFEHDSIHEIRFANIPII